MGIQNPLPRIEQRQRIKLRQNSQQVTLNPKSTSIQNLHLLLQSRFQMGQIMVYSMIPCTISTKVNQQNCRYLRHINPNSRYHVRLPHLSRENRTMKISQQSQRMQEECSRKTLITNKPGMMMTMRSIQLYRIDNEENWNGIFFY